MWVDGLNLDPPVKMGRVWAGLVPANISEGFGDYKDRNSQPMMNSQTLACEKGVVFIPCMCFHK